MTFLYYIIASAIYLKYKYKTIIYLLLDLFSYYEKDDILVRERGELLRSNIIYPSKDKTLVDENIKRYYNNRYLRYYFKKRI